MLIAPALMRAAARASACRSLFFDATALLLPPLVDVMPMPLPCRFNSISRHMSPQAT